MAGASVELRTGGLGQGRPCVMACRTSRKTCRLLLPVPGTVCLNMSRPHPTCFPRSPQGFSLQAFLPMMFTANFVVPEQ